MGVGLGFLGEVLLRRLGSASCFLKEIFESFVAVCCGLRSGWDSNLTVTDRTLVELQLVFWCSFLMVS